MELFSHNITFNILVYILKKIEINIMNEKHLKTF